MLKKRLEAEAEMWDLWRMGEEEEAVSAEDTDFACRCVKNPNINFLKVPKREIFDRSDFPDFYTINSSWVGDLLVKILTYYFNF